MDAVVVIRAGGFGTRLWPKSRRALPKQFLVLYGDKTLLQHSYDRALATVKDPSAIYVSVQERHVELVLSQLPLDREHIIVEPCARNTGAAICLETCFLMKRYKQETMVLTMPSDDYVGNLEAFIKMYAQGKAFLIKNPAAFFTVAVPMTGVDTGFSYLSGKKQGEEYVVDSWIEKPDRPTCEGLWKQHTYFTHVGLYMWQLHTMHAQGWRVAPQYMQASDTWIQNQDRRAYESLEKASVEKLLIQKSDTIGFVVSEDLHWQDVGTWSRLQQLLPVDTQGNTLVGKGILQDAHGIFLHGQPQKTVIVSGLRDIAVIDTPDVLYICPKASLDAVQKTVEFLEKEESVL